MSIPVPDHIPPADELGRVHFIGIGGAGLSAIATARKVLYPKLFV